MDCYKKCYYDNKWLGISKDKVKYFIINDSEFKLQSNNDKNNNQEALNLKIEKLELTKEFNELVNQYPVLANKDNRSYYGGIICSSKYYEFKNCDYKDYDCYVDECKNCCNNNLQCSEICHDTIKKKVQNIKLEWFI